MSKALNTAAPAGTFDVHHHVGHLGGFGDAPDAAPTPAQDAAARLAYMDRYGIAECLLMPGPYPAAGAAGGLSPVNDSVAAYCALHPDRFTAWAANVDHRDVGAAREEIDRCVALGARAIAWHHHFIGTVINHNGMRPLIERVHEHGLPVFVHIAATSFLESPWRLEVLADEFSETTFVALDGFSSPDQCQWMAYIARRHPNIMFDTGVAPSVAHTLPEFIASAGAERLLFGSDFYSAPKLFEIPFVLLELLNAGLEPAQLDAVFAGNARRVLELGQPAGDQRSTRCSAPPSTSASSASDSSPASVSQRSPSS